MALGPGEALVAGARGNGFSGGSIPEPKTSGDSISAWRSMHVATSTCRRRFFRVHVLRLNSRAATALGSSWRSSTVRGLR
jgi:hypothetical protein